MPLAVSLCLSLSLSLYLAVSVGLSLTLSASHCLSLSLSRLSWAPGRSADPRGGRGEGEGCEGFGFTYMVSAFENSVSGTKFRVQETGFTGFGQRVWVPLRRSRWSSGCRTPRCHTPRGARWCRNRTAPGARDRLKAHRLLYHSTEG